MDVLLRTTAPLFAARYQLELHDAFRAGCHLDATVYALVRARQQHPHAGFQVRKHLRTADDLTEMRRADFLLALADQHKIYWKFFAAGLERAKCAQKRILRALLVDRAATHAHCAEPGLLH